MVAKKAAGVLLQEGALLGVCLRFIRLWQLHWRLATKRSRAPCPEMRWCALPS
jgi:hypothetical protein